MYICCDCDWAGPNPSFTDTSEPAGDPQMPSATEHKPVCPQCFSDKLDIEMKAAS